MAKYGHIWWHYNNDAIFHYIMIEAGEAGEAGCSVRIIWVFTSLDKEGPLYYMEAEVRAAKKTGKSWELIM